MKSVIDGLALRTAGNALPALVDHRRKRTVAGKVALALIHSFCEPAQNVSGLPLEQAVLDMIRGDQEPVA